MARHGQVGRTAAVTIVTPGRPQRLPTAAAHADAAKAHYGAVARAIEATGHRVFSADVRRAVQLLAGREWHSATATSLPCNR
jgi:hypothetical protein